MNVIGVRTPQSLSDDGSPRDVDDESDIKPDVDKKRARKLIILFLLKISADE